MELEILITAVIAFGLGWGISTLFNRWVFSMLLQQLGITHETMLKLADDLAKTPDEAAIRIRLEQEQGQIYAYRKDTAEFLGQGTDADTLLARLNENMQPCRVVVEQADGADLLQKNNTQTG
jgi:hypothetical protein